MAGAGEVGAENSWSNNEMSAGVGKTILDFDLL